MLFCGKSKQSRAHQRSVGQIERQLCFLVQQRLEVRLLFVRSERRKIFNRQRERRGRKNDLCGLPISLDEAGAQAFVPAYEFAKATLERDCVEPAIQAHYFGNVVERAIRFELVQKPETLLRVRQ